MNWNIGRTLAAGLLLCVTAPTWAQGVEQATANSAPWSGWWWPAKTGNLVVGYRNEPGAMPKHDQVTGRHSAQWEQGSQFHYNLSGPDWWGHCHAWAAAALLEQEPKHDVYDGGVPFRVGDIKGLLSEAHYSDRASFFGQRYNGNTGDDLEDMYPFLVWYVLRTYINQNKTGLVFDLNPGPQVWSYPAYRYSLSFQPLDQGSYQSAVAAAGSLERRSGSQQSFGYTYYQAQLSIWVATFEVYPDIVGTSPEQHNYTFVFAAQGNQLVMNSDHWTGASLQDHPDFAWYPTQRVQGNTELDYNMLNQLNLQAQ